MKLIGTTDKDGVGLLLDAMSSNPRYNISGNIGNLQYSEYQIAVIPVTGGVMLDNFYQTKWDRVDYSDTSPPYYIMPLLSGLRIQLHVSSSVKMFCSNGKVLKGEGLHDVADAMLNSTTNSIYEAVWRKSDGVCYITDVVMSNGVNLTSEPFKKRYEILQQTPFVQPVRVVPIEVVESNEDLDDFMSDKGSAVIREGDSPVVVSVYQLEDISHGDNTGVYAR